MADESEPRPRALQRRRRANAAVARTYSHRVKVTPEEEAMLVLRADRLNVTVARLLLESALAAAPVETVTERRAFAVELLKLRRLLSATATNINQIAKVTNATSTAPKETEATLAALRRTVERVDTLLEQAVGA